MEFKALTPLSYLEQCLEVEKSFSGDSEQKNQVRQMIKSIFPTLDCHSIVQPIGDDDLWNIENMFFNQLNPDFQKNCKDLV